MTCGWCTSTQKVCATATASRGTWFQGVDGGSLILQVALGGPPGDAMICPIDQLSDGHPLMAAFGWARQDAVIDGGLVDEVDHQHGFFNLPDAVDAADASSALSPPRDADTALAMTTT